MTICPQTQTSFSDSKCHQRMRLFKATADEAGAGHFADQGLVADESILTDAPCRIQSSWISSRAPVDGADPASMRSS